MHRQDILWKGLLEDIFDDFLSFLYPEVWSILDRERGFVFLDKELEQVFPPEEDQYSSKVVDKLVKVYTLEGRRMGISTCGSAGRVPQRLQRKDVHLPVPHI